MRLISCVPFAFLVAAPGTVPTPDWSHADQAEVTLSNFKFAPRSLHLKADRPVILHIVNTASGGHNFTARAFFDTAAVRPTDAAMIHEGTVEVPEHQSVDIGLVPRAGQYPLKCTHSFHRIFGMKGEIIVG
ncbi:cupredoxin domain-containing protein [Sphingobium aquiterrae]|uniref:cupredoxin domain-containing protein n=1 Tax=Sphingobium aquiterrae TaxID=2038656 RepID=UPI00301A8EC0